MNKNYLMIDQKIIFNGGKNTGVILHFVPLIWYSFAMENNKKMHSLTGGQKMYKLKKMWREGS